MKLLSLLTLLFCTLIFAGCTEDITLGEESTTTPYFEKRARGAVISSAPSIEVDCAKMQACPQGGWTDIQFNLCEENYYFTDLYLWVFQDGEAEFIGMIDDAEDKTRYRYRTYDVALAGDITLYVSGSSEPVTCDSPYTYCGGSVESCSPRYDADVEQDCNITFTPGGYICPMGG